MEIEYDEVWNRFDDEFHFRPSTGPFLFSLGRGIKEPSPSETYSIAHIFGQGKDHYKDLNNDLMVSVLAMFQSLTATDEWIYALDWQHQTFQFFPHVAFSLNEFGEWPFTHIAERRLLHISEEKLRVGCFGHPWEKTMCFWGEELLSFMHDNRPKLLSKLIRKK